jgi:hypothetical protein
MIVLNPMTSGHLMQYCSETKDKNTGKYTQTYIFQVDVDSFTDENVLLIPLLAKWEGGISINTLDKDEFLSLGEIVQDIYLDLRENRIGPEYIDCNIFGEFRTAVVCNANEINKVLRNISETINLFDSKLINQLKNEYLDCPFVICYWRGALSPEAVVINFEPKIPGILYYPGWCKKRGNNLYYRKDANRNATFLFGHDLFGKNIKFNQCNLKSNIWGKLMIGDDFNCDYYFDLNQLKNEEGDFINLWDIEFISVHTNSLLKKNNAA